MITALLLAGCASAPNMPPGSPRASTSSEVVEITTSAVPTSQPTTPPPAVGTTTTTSTTTSTTSSTTTSTTTTTPTTTTTVLPSDCASFEELGDVSVTEAVISGPWPRIDGDFEAIGSVPAESAGRTLHLGFDVEGDPGPVLALLDALDLHRVGTTFFVQGQWAELHPELVREIVSRGHELANHAYGGELLGAASEERILEELTRTEQLVLDATGLSTKPYLRWPNGDASDDGVLIAADAGWRTIYWSGGADDFVSGADADSMCSALLYHSRPGAILLAHTFHPDISEAVDRYLRQIQPYGYVVVPLSVLLADDPESMLERVD